MSLVTDHFQQVFSSVVERRLDVVVCGAGFTGYALARKLAEKGHSVLLLENSGDLLWEATRALENTTGGKDLPDAWRDWLAGIQHQGETSADWFDPAEAEVLTADFLQQANPQLTTLLYSVPLAVETKDGLISALTVATKGGPRRIQAFHWVDATEEGDLLKLITQSEPPRKPDTLYRNVVLQSLQAEKIDALASALAARHTGLEILPSVRETERRLRLPVSGNTGWHQTTVGLARDLRELLDEQSAFLISHCAMRDFPLYLQSPEPVIERLPSNCTAASPSWRGDAVASPGERFALGLKIADSIQLPVGKEEDPSPSASDSPVLPKPDSELTGYDIVVVGAGTAGAIAAIAAARNGAKTLAIDFNEYPGGVGTGAGICGYFHGQKGGLQDEVDLRVRDMSESLGDRRPIGGWHHEAKKIVLLDLFEEAGADFIGSAMLTGVETNGDGRIEAVLTIINGQQVRIPGQCFIDGTGDGDLCALAGARYESGRTGDGRTLAYSQGAFTITRKDKSLSLQGSNFDAGWTDPNDPEDFTRARLTGIAQYKDIQWPEDKICIAMAPWIGLRQSRQIFTDTRVTLADMVSHSTFPDAVGSVSTVADSHSVDFEFESDEFAFYIWTCRAFRQLLACELPYGMLLPSGLSNVWIPCRAAGIEVDASYGLRMQREMQRLGEVSGIAAALAIRGGCGSREIDFNSLKQALLQSGALTAEKRTATELPPDESLVSKLAEGRPGMHLWHIGQRRSVFENTVREQLQSGNPQASFYAAVILALWGESCAEERLIEAISTHESGPSPEDFPVRGAHGQCIDLPFWLQAALFLRKIGTSKCLPALRKLAEDAPPFLNVRTAIALTLEKLAERLGPETPIVESLDILSRGTVSDSIQPPSFSLWRKLQGEPQQKLRNDKGAPVDEDHGWQLHLVLARTCQHLGLPLPAQAEIYARDPRAFVRQAFRSFLIPDHMHA